MVHEDRMAQMANVATQGKMEWLEQLGHRGHLELRVLLALVERLESVAQPEPRDSLERPGHWGLQDLLVLMDLLVGLVSKDCKGAQVRLVVPEWLE